MTRPQDELGGLEAPSAYTATGVIYHRCTGCGAEPGHVCTFEAEEARPGLGIVAVTKPRNFPCVNRFVENPDA